MTQEEKQLLLQDLCARLPYHTIVSTGEEDLELVKVDILNGLVYVFSESFLEFDVSEIKPYLRPMSSMTEEEKRQYGKLCDEDIRQLTSVQIVHPGLKYKTSCHRSIDWLNKNMFDYRRLIEKGLALEVSKGMYEY